jgi:hypothetical protein
LECDPIRSPREMEAAGIRFTAEGVAGGARGSLTSSSAGPKVQYGVITLFMPWVSKLDFFPLKYLAVLNLSWTVRTLRT